MLPWPNKILWGLSAADTHYFACAASCLRIPAVICSGLLFWLRSFDFKVNVQEMICHLGVWACKFSWYSPTFAWGALQKVGEIYLANSRTKAPPLVSHLSKSSDKDTWVPTLKLHFPTIVQHLDSCEKLKTANKLCIHSNLLIVSGILNRVCRFPQPSPVATWLSVCLPHWLKMMNDDCFSSPGHAAYRGDEKWKSSPPKH